MAFLGLLSYLVLTICFLVLVVYPCQALASSGLSVKNVVAATTHGGYCASSIIIHGYKCEEHEVTTKDGYILSMQRIPEGRTNANGGTTKKQPVIMQHGVLVDGMTWLMNRPEQNLPMILAENGFDVWISNARGTRYSRRHTHLDPSQPAFWDWSFDQMVEYELPSIFDYVFNKTGQKINYVGHSLGTLVALTSFSERKLVNQLRAAALLSPIAYLTHMTTLLGQAAARNLVGEAYTLLGLPEFDPKALLTITMIQSLCTEKQLDCNDLMTAVTGKNCCLNSSTVDLFVENEPQSSATKNMLHLSQIVRQGFVSKFNYVIPDLNIKHYGQMLPPIYNFSNIPNDLPIFMSYGGADALSDVLDVRALLDSFKSHDADKLTVQFIKEYGHADFILGFNANDLVYNSVLEFFKRGF